MKTSKVTQQKGCRLNYIFWSEFFLKSTDTEKTTTAGKDSTDKTEDSKTDDPKDKDKDKGNTVDDSSKPLIRIKVMLRIQLKLMMTQIRILQKRMILKKLILRILN
ncbi:hypothetical protein SDC49_21970 [Lactobacillus sp. R2/2]|nr:hypothetical protein [Lactobacillus sp. R2/2]